MDNQLALLTLFGSIIALLFVASRALHHCAFVCGKQGAEGTPFPGRERDHEKDFRIHPQGCDGVPAPPV